jgi:hypothetical protein
MVILFAWSAYYSTLKMEAICSSEMLNIYMSSHPKGYSSRLSAVPNSTAALTSHMFKAQHLYCKVERTVITVSLTRVTNNYFWPLLSNYSSLEGTNDILPQPTQRHHPPRVSCENGYSVVTRSFSQGYSLLR